MKKNVGHNKKGGYSIIAAVLMVGFLLVLTTGTLNLVLQEMQDGKGRQDYMKAYAGAEGSLELALLKIKQEGYGYDDDSFQGSEILGTGNTVPKLSYDFESKVTEYSGSITKFESDIIPLFWIDNAGGASSISSSINFQTDSQMIWNLIGSQSGLSKTGDFDESTSVGNKTVVEVLDDQNFEYNSITVENFLSANPESYLILYNPTSADLDYTLTSSEGFTLPRATISSSAHIGKYTQNLETVVDNTKFLGILKYSIYSGN